MLLAKEICAHRKFQDFLTGAQTFSFNFNEQLNLFRIAIILMSSLMVIWVLNFSPFCFFFLKFLFHKVLLRLIFFNDSSILRGCHSMHSLFIVICLGTCCQSVLGVRMNLPTQAERSLFLKHDILHSSHFFICDRD